MSRMWVCVAMLLATAGTASLAQSPAEGRVAIGLELFPRLLALDVELEQKRSTDGSLRVWVVYSSQSREADRCADVLRRKAAMIRGTRTTFSVSSVADLVSAVSPPTAILIVEPIPAGDRERVLAYARQHQRIVFSPFEGDVERGVTAGIFIGARVQLYFNVRALDASRVRLDPGLLRLSRVYE